jgi:hypothetical protein
LYKSKKRKRKEITLEKEIEKKKVFRSIGILGKLYNIIIYFYTLASCIAEFYFILEEGLYKIE